MLTVDHLSVSYRKDLQAVRDVSFCLEEGQWLMLCGPNGAGKTSVLHAITRTVPFSGSVIVMGKDLRTLSHRQLARNLGMLSQVHSVNYAYTVEDIVRLGQYAHRQGLLSSGNRHEEDRTQEALTVTGMLPFRSQSILTLSGGEVQRAFLAQVFAQNPAILLLDEPANHLDLIYQKQIFGLIQSWLQVPGRAVLSVVHDLTLARRFGTHAILMDQGTILTKGTIDAVFTPAHLNAAYHMDVYAWMRENLRVWSDS
ncbi:MAG: ABC transporter ATP-binding protein [Clostridia bacterium]|nr:ABC transporter ATP-binding protein [Clostridia bacterium]